jgi:ACS family hexuronate transporter-like MFS transporter
MPAPASEPAVAKDKGVEGRWSILALVFVAIMLNYVDRQILALLKPTLQAEFRWSDRDYAHMASAFQFAAAIAFLGTGWFIDRVGLRRGFGIGVALWSLAGMAHAFAATVTQFVAARAALGAAESIGTPAAVKAAATYFPARERSRALGIANTAPNFGAILTPLLIPALALAVGWRASFLIAGGLGLVWVVVWLRVARPAAATLSHGEPWAALLRDRRTLAVAAAKVLSDQVWWFLLFWTPDLFHRQFGLAQGALGAPVALAYGLAALGAITGGWLPGMLLARGWTLERSRLVTLLVYAVLVVPVPLVLVAGNAWTAALLLGFALFAHQGFSTNVFGLATDIFPAARVGSVIGIGAFAGNLAGMAMLEFAGWSLDAGHGYAPMFWSAAFSYLVGVALVRLVLPRSAYTALG